MNRHSRAIIQEFTTVENQQHIRDCLVDRFNARGVVLNFLKDHLAGNVMIFTKTIEQELYFSEPIRGINAMDQLKVFNKQFLLQEEKFIIHHVLDVEEETPVFALSDGISLSRYGREHYAGAPDDILKSWWLNSGRTAQARDDTAGDIYPNNNYYKNSNDIVGHHLAHPNLIEKMNSVVKPQSGEKEKMSMRQYGSKYYPAVKPQEKSMPLYDYGLHDPTVHYPKYAAVANRCAPSTTGDAIVFCDQSRVGTSNHVAQYDTTYKNAMNSTTRPHEHTEFGWSTPSADARLLSRKIFRGDYSQNSTENGIPSFEKRLYRRALDRDIDEALPNSEKDFKLYGHDMSSLHNRIDRKRETQAKYRPVYPNCAGGSKLNINMPRENIHDDARYC